MQELIAAATAAPAAGRADIRRSLDTSRLPFVRVTAPGRCGHGLVLQSSVRQFRIRYLDWDKAIRGPAPAGVGYRP
jgi:hypothetical protein